MQFQSLVITEMQEFRFWSTLVCAHSLITAITNDFQIISKRPSVFDMSSFERFGHLFIVYLFFVGRPSTSFETVEDFLHFERTLRLRSY